MRFRQRTHRHWAWSLAASWCLATACSEECPFDEDEGDRPVAAIECPSGELCYRGTCVRACNAGREGLVRCRSDDDCSGARPFCGGPGDFCSACPGGERCVPTLDICRPVSAPRSIPIPERPEDNDFVPEGPLDAGLTDARGLVRFPDAGGDDPAAPAPTIAAHFEMAREMTAPSGGSCEDPPAPARSSAPFVTVLAWDVRGTVRPSAVSWRPDLVPAGTESLAAERLRDGQCEVRSIDTATVAAVDLGEVAFEDAADAEVVLDDWSARFDGSAYDVRAFDGAPNPLVFVPNQRFAEPLGRVQIFGFGRDERTNGTFGAELDLPFDFRVDCATWDALSAGLEIPKTPQSDLVLGWRDPLNGATGQVVYARIDGSAFGYELVCEERESSGRADIVVTPAILTGFRGLLDASGAFEAGARALPFELGRRTARRVRVDPAPSEQIFATAEVALRYVASIRFAPP